MWSDWLADTLNRSTFAALAPDAAPQRVGDTDDVNPAFEADWDVVTGLLIHEGFGAEYPDA
jgi:hypothetical protein